MSLPCPFPHVLSLSVHVPTPSSICPGLLPGVREPRPLQPPMLQFHFGNTASGMCPGGTTASHWPSEQSNRQTDKHVRTRPIPTEMMPNRIGATGHGWSDTSKTPTGSSNCSQPLPQLSGKLSAITMHTKNPSPHLKDTQTLRVNASLFVQRFF